MNRCNDHPCILLKIFLKSIEENALLRPCLAKYEPGKDSRYIHPKAARGWAVCIVGGGYAVKRWRCKH